MAKLTPAQRSTAARIAAYALHAQGKTNTQPARAALFARFEDEVDPDRVLDPAERRKRAQAAFSAHMSRMALASSRARRKTKIP